MHVQAEPRSRRTGYMTPQAIAAFKRSMAERATTETPTTQATPPIVSLDTQTVPIVPVPAVEIQGTGNPQ